jgi:CDP-paratose 2-epimerase
VKGAATILVTGGAGFVGTNLAYGLLRSGRRVTILDDLRRPGSERNAAWLEATHPDRLQLVRAPMADRAALEAAVSGAEAIVHLAAQVAVTSSLADPAEDLQVNVVGTLNLLEAVRRHAPESPLLYASTNKVYGQLQGRTDPVGEDQALDPHTPYACSKAAADQYVRDYHRCFGLRTVALRQSCVYGPHQHGTEDQGWVAHFARSILAGQPLTVYGDGGQVRDLLQIDDLVALYEAAIEGIDRCAGLALNVGGGPANARTVLGISRTLEELTGRPARLDFADWRAGDQRYFVSDVSTAAQLLGWEPRIGVEAGLERMLGWMASIPDRPPIESVVQVVGDRSS